MNRSVISIMVAAAVVGLAIAWGGHRSRPESPTRWIGTLLTGPREAGDTNELEVVWTPIVAVGLRGDGTMVWREIPNIAVPKEPAAPPFIKLEPNP